MANTKSAKKMIRVINKRTMINRAIKSKLKTMRKKCEANIAICAKANSEDTKNMAVTSFKIAQKTIYKSCTKGIIHKNKAARLVSRMNRKLKEAVVQG